MKVTPGWLLFFVGVFFYLPGIQATGKPPEIKLGPPPNWIKSVSPEYKPVPGSKAMQSGYYYLLFNTQECIRLQQRYVHIAVKVLNNEGVQSMSDISIDFDPVYEKLEFHSLRLIRDGKMINKLNRDEIRLIQREVNSERYMYDGSQTALVNLKDVRVNDIIEYSWSTTGFNPIFGGRYSGVLPLEFTIPVKHLFHRLMVPDDEVINFKYLNGASQAVISRKGDEVCYQWEEQDVPAITFDIGTPLWYNPMKRVSISQYGSWGEVSKWGCGLFAVSAAEKIKLTPLIKDIVCTNPSDSVIIQSIRFVQDKVRYLAFEDGLNSFKPVQPVLVMEQLYGDCKSKSLLLAEILKLRGIEAWPVLVNTETGKVLEEKLPSPFAFNHCVTGFSFRGKNWYVDPTFSNQGGDLDHLYFPNYRKGLELKAGSNALTDLPLNLSASIKVSEHFTIDNMGGGATLKVTTAYNGGNADFQRSFLATSNPGDITREYQNFYSQLYPSIKPLGDIVIHDQRYGPNSIVVEEQYSIDSLWTRSKEFPDMIIGEFYPLWLAHYITGKKSPARTMPYSLTFPIDLHHQTVVELPVEINIKEKDIHKESDLYQFSYSTQIKDKELKIVYLYKTLNDHAPAEKVESFLADLNELTNTLTYRISYDTSQPKARQNSWFSIIVAFVVAGFSVFFARRIYLRPVVPQVSPNLPSRKIGGWLIYFAIVITVYPFSLVKANFIDIDFFNSRLWEPLFDLDGSLRSFINGCMVFIELVLYTALVVFSFFAVIMFFRRRRGFPTFYIWLATAITLIPFLDSVIVHSISESSNDSSSSGIFVEFLPRITFTVVAILYFLNSKRVKETFNEPSISLIEDRSTEEDQEVISHNLPPSSPESQ